MTTHAEPPADAHVRHGLTRREVVTRVLGISLGMSGLLAACSAPAASPTSAPAAAPTTAAAAKPTSAPAAAPTTAPAAAPTTAAAKPTAAAAAPAQATATRPLTPTFYQWIVDLHPSLPQVNDAFKQSGPLNFQIAPVQGIGIDRFHVAAKGKSSTWEVSGG